MTVTERLREAIRQSGLTNYRIGKDIGVSIRTIDRFFTEGRPATTDTFDALCEYFVLELRPKKTGTTVKQAVKKTATKRKRRKKSAE